VQLHVGMPILDQAKGHVRVRIDPVSPELRVEADPCPDRYGSCLVVGKRHGVPHPGTRPGVRRDLLVWSRITLSASFSLPRWEDCPFSRSRTFTPRAHWWGPRGVRLSRAVPLETFVRRAEATCGKRRTAEGVIRLTRQSLALWVSLWIILVSQEVSPHFRKSGVNPHAAPRPGRSPSPGRCISTPWFWLMASVTRVSAATSSPA
jgi:hypothetical protein